MATRTQCRAEKIASRIVAVEVPVWVSPAFVGQLNVAGTILKKFSGTLHGIPIWALKGQVKIYKDTFGWVSASWSINPVLDGQRWIVESDLSFAPATSGSFANDKFVNEFPVTVRTHGEKRTAVFGIESRVLSVLPDENDLAGATRDVNNIIATHDGDLRDAKKYWKQQQAVFDEQHRGRYGFVRVKQSRSGRIASRVVATLLEHIDYKNLPTLWYEDESGNKYVPPMDGELPEMPEGFKYQHSRFPNVLREDILEITDDGSKQVMSGNSSWSQDLVFALTKKGLTLSEAILVAATACERCMNVLADECGLSWGYAWGSEAWRKSHTECDFCREGPRVE